MQEILYGFVFIDSDTNEVLTYDQIRGLELEELMTCEGAYFGGYHGINGLCYISEIPDLQYFLDVNGFEVADVHTPWFNDGRLAAEPEAEAFMSLDPSNPRNQELCRLAVNGMYGLPGIVLDEDDAPGEAIPFTGKLSISMVEGPFDKPKVSCSIYKMMPWLEPVPKPAPKDRAAPKASAPKQEAAKPAEQPSFAELVEAQRATIKGMFGKF